VKSVLGYTPEEFIGKNIFAKIHPEDLPKVQEMFQEMLAEPGRMATLQFRYRHKDGSWRHLESIAQNRLADQDIAAVVVNSRDVTDRWRVEEELRGSEKQYRLLFQGQSESDVGVRSGDVEVSGSQRGDDPALRLFRAKNFWR
jgi:PAS domain S-box-containing protein